MMKAVKCILADKNAVSPVFPAAFLLSGTEKLYAARIQPFAPSVRLCRNKGDVNEVIFSYPYQDRPQRCVFSVPLLLLPVLFLSAP